MTKGNFYLTCDRGGILAELTKEEIELIKIDELMIINNMKKNDDVSRIPIKARETIIKKLEGLKWEESMKRANS